MRSIDRLAVAALLSLNCAPVGAQTTNGKKLMHSPLACTRTVNPSQAERLQPILKELPEGAILCLEPGRYLGAIVIKRSLTIRGLGRPEEVILDGKHVPGVVKIDPDDAKIVLANLTITGGSANPYATLGGLVVGGHSDVLVEDVVITGNRCEVAGAQAIWASAGRLVLSRCRIVGNKGRLARAVYAREIASVTIRDSLIADNEAGLSDVALSGSGRYVIERSTIVAGGGRAALEVAAAEGSCSVSDSILVGRPKALESEAPGRISIARSVIAGEAGPFTDGGGNRTAAMAFASGREAYLPAPGSAAIGLAHSPSGTRDLAGHPRGETGGAAGAFETE